MAALSPPLSKRIYIAALIGLAAAVVNFEGFKPDSDGVDFLWSARAAREIIRGEDPYKHAPRRDMIPYPLTAAFVAMPFAWLPYPLGGAIFIGISSGLAAFGLTREGVHRSFSFISFPYFLALSTTQWSPLFVALRFFPLLLPAALAKPNAALPVALLSVSRKGVVISAGLLCATLAVYPAWPIKWVSQLKPFVSYIPLWTLPGPLILLVLFRWRQKESWLLLLSAVLPSHAPYDAFILWLIPRTAQEVLFTSLISWGLIVCRFMLVDQMHIRTLGALVVLFCYLPMVAVLLLRGSKAKGANSTGL
jgi:hypothetical protein